MRRTQSVGSRHTYNNVARLMTMCCRDNVRWIDQRPTTNMRTKLVLQGHLQFKISFISLSLANQMLALPARRIHPVWPLLRQRYALIASLQAAMRPAISPLWRPKLENK